MHPEAKNDTLVIHPARNRRHTYATKRLPNFKNIKAFKNRISHNDEEEQPKPINENNRAQMESCLGHKRSYKLQLLHIARNLEYNVSKKF